jgi:DNA-binding beta-propeller fold protein YncE
VGLAGGEGIAKINPLDGAIVRYNFNGAAAALAFDGANMWVCDGDHNTVSKLTPSGQVSGTFPVGNFPKGLAFDGTNLWVSKNGSNTVTKLALDGQTLGTFPVGQQPIGLVFDGAAIWVANSGAGTISKLALDGALLGTFASSTPEAGQQPPPPQSIKPYGLAFDGVNVWVSNSGIGTVAKR